MLRISTLFSVFCKSPACWLLSQRCRQVRDWLVSLMPGSSLSLLTASARYQILNTRGDLLCPSVKNFSDGESSETGNEDGPDQATVQSMLAVYH